MKNQKGISLIKLIIFAVIIIVVIIAIFFILSRISQEIEKKQLEKENQTIYNVGDTITTVSDKLEITVKNIEERERVGNSNYFKLSGKSYTFLCATIEIKNISNESYEFLTSIEKYNKDFSQMFRLKFNVDSERVYYNDNDATRYYGLEFNNLVNKYNIEPNETITVVIVFKVEKFLYDNSNLYLDIPSIYGNVKIK